jgi:DNA-directed RNA polymerase specialized sigma24 family protein
MKNSREYWIRDLEQLMDETVVKDAVAELIEKLDGAIQALPVASQELISKYFEGASIEQLAREHNVSPEEMALWLERAKRELAQGLRARCPIKQ